MNEFGINEGDIIAQKYLIKRVIGEGGMALVFVAKHIMLDRLVALKILRSSFLSNPEVMSRFISEARAVSHLSSEHIARVLDIGVLEHGEPFLVMEYLQGADLGSVLYERGKLPLGEAVDLIMQAMDAIAEAHAQGIVHRDLKPENLFLTSRPDGTPLIKVLDFGIARAATEYGREELGLTQATSTFGSPFYMSPEQIRSAHDVDARADIWSLGVILYELVSGQQPFSGMIPLEIITSVLRDEAIPLNTICPDLPAEFVALIHKCLNKDRGLRLPTIALLAKAIAPYGGKSARLYASRIQIVLDGGSPALPPPAMPPEVVIIQKQYNHSLDDLLSTSDMLIVKPGYSTKWSRKMGLIIVVVFCWFIFGAVATHHFRQLTITAQSNVSLSNVTETSAAPILLSTTETSVAPNLLSSIEIVPVIASVSASTPTIHINKTVVIHPRPSKIKKVPLVKNDNPYNYENDDVYKNRR